MRSFTHFAAMNKTKQSVFQSEPKFVDLTVSFSKCFRFLVQRNKIENQFKKKLVKEKKGTHT